MREIKFRAWDKENNCWYQPVHEAYRGNLFELLVDFSGRLGVHTMEGMKDESLFPDRFILQQYTGLKDRNGKEIYEGDAISDWWSGRNKGVVYFKDGCFMANIYKLANCPYDIDVIGNIYENPELLQEEKENG